MPELPEVETTLQGLLPHILQQKISSVIIRQYKLRWPIPQKLPQYLNGQTIQQISRRGKYLLFHCNHGTLIIHLGMSGSLQIVDNNKPALKHDHVDLVLNNHKIIRFNDPRRFGSILWTDQVRPPLSATWS